MQRVYVTTPGDRVFYAPEDGWIISWKLDPGGLTVFQYNEYAEKNMASYAPGAWTHVGRLE